MIGDIVDILAGHPDTADAEFAVGDVVLIRQAIRGFQPGRFICAIPRGWNPSAMVALIAESLTLRSSTRVRATTHSRRLVVCGYRGIVQLVVANNVKAPGARTSASLEALVYEHGARSKPSSSVHAGQLGTWI